MPITSYESIHKSKIESQIQARYQIAINDLSVLRFGNLQHVREVTFPLSVIIFFFMYPLLKRRGDIFRIESPLRFVLMHPLLFNYEYSTYVTVDGAGTTFLTLFMDDTILMTHNHHNFLIEDANKKFYKYPTRRGTTIPIMDAWQRHLSKLDEIERKGRETDDQLNIAKFEYIISRNDKMVLKAPASSLDF
jgi:hypothetical protein